MFFVFPAKSDTKSRLEEFRYVISVNINGGKEADMSDQ